ncbi:hypothetical protein ACMHYJ_07500 [Castellaniella hirudinis]|uniref:hypothetical protein n=1 Tax=Castellaniella hirudinis TaxID=1144617 RepID=UPI0039C486AA
MKALISAWILALVFGLGSLMPAAAQVTEATVTADGQGLSRDDAIQAALVNAASQAFGVRLASQSVVQNTAVDAAVDAEDHSVLVSVLNKSVQQALNTPQNAPILGYDVNNVFQAGSGWEATVTLRYAKFERMGADTNRRSAVVVSNNKRYRALLIQTVGESLVGSRRFDVLNRENDALFQDEKAFIAGDDAADAEMARLSQASGADYLVVASLPSLGVSNNQRETIAMTGEVLVKSAASGTLQLQVIEFASRKVKWSGSQKFGGTYPGATSVGSATLSRLISGAADKLIDRMVAAIYPIQVVKVVKADTAIINRGEGGVAVGETYAVFEAGEELIDPQSGESLGSMETEIGLGKITQVKPKFAFLRMSTGALSEGTTYIVRKTDKKPAVAAKPAPRKKAASQPQPPDRGDVFLNN